MKRILIPFCLLLVCLFCFSVPFAYESAKAAEEIGPYDLVVSPTGDDGAQGTLDDPLKTVTEARNRLRAFKESLSYSALPEGTRITVFLRGGRYEFTDTLCFTEDDLPYVTYKAYNHEEVIFSGAREITGFQVETVNGIRVFTKTLSESDPREFKSLFNQSGSLRIPRYPESGYFIVNKLDPENDLWTEETSKWDLTLGQRSFFADPNDLKTDFTNYEDVQVRILHYWKDELMYLTDFNRTTGRIGLSRPASMKIRDIDRYYFENVFEAMNEPGEWYLNSKTKKLYYVPQEGEKADTLVLYASDRELLVDINGVDGLQFEGIRFTQTDWNMPDPKNVLEEDSWNVLYDVDTSQAAYTVLGVVTAKYADNLTFKNCEFIDLGADAIKLMHGVTNSAVKNCLFRNIAATAVFIGGDNCQPDDPECIKNITVKNCDISGYGRKFYSAIGIHITYCDGAELSHNEISDGYYTGISVGWVWGYTYHLTRNIKITDNLIYNIGQGWLSDMGGIYMLGIQPGTVLSGNVIHNVSADPSEGGYGGWGIYLDEGSSRMLVEYNLVFCCGSQSYNIHYGEGNIIRNNIGALSAEGQVSVGTNYKEDHATAYYYDNIFVSKNGEPIYIYMSNTSHFYENGNLFWDLTKGEKVCFAVDDYPDQLSLRMAKLRGFLHNPTVKDPLFTDIDNYDFTLKKDSPAFGLNFKSWDYDNAGTEKGEIIGFNLEGGKTAYNANVKAVTGTKTAPKQFQKYLPLFLLLLMIVLLITWLVYGFCKCKDKSGWAFLLTVIAFLAGIAVFYFFTHWSAIGYALSLVGLQIPIALLAAISSYVKNHSKKRAVITAIIWLVVLCVLFFGLTLLLNNFLKIGEILAISCALFCSVLSIAILSISIIVRNKKTKIKRK